MTAPAPEPIRSTDNATFRELRQLAHSARERRKRQRTVLDGAHLLRACLDSGIVPALVATTPEAALRAEVAQLLARCNAIPCVRMSATLMAQASPVDTPTGVLAMIDMPVPPHVGAVTTTCVVLDGVQDVGNLGSIMRSAAAAGVRTVVLLKGCAQAWSPRALRAGMGAQFGLRLIEHAEPATVLAGFPGAIAAALPDAPASLYSTDLRGEIAWLFGAEGQGVSADALALTTLRLRIPMPGGSESLNVAAAAAVCLFEQVRQRARVG